MINLFKRSECYRKHTYEDVSEKSINIKVMYFNKPRLPSSDSRDSQLNNHYFSLLYFTCIAIKICGVKFIFLRHVIY